MLEAGGWGRVGVHSNGKIKGKVSEKGILKERGSPRSEVHLHGNMEGKVSTFNK